MLADRRASATSISSLRHSCTQQRRPISISMPAPEFWPYRRPRPLGNGRPPLWVEIRFSGRHSPKYPPILMKFGRDRLLHGVHSVVSSVWPHRCMGSSRLDENNFVFFSVIPKCTILQLGLHTTLLHGFGGKPIIKGVGSGFCCRAKIREVSIRERSQSQKTAVFQYSVHNLQ